MEIKLLKLTVYSLFYQILENCYHFKNNLIVSDQVV